MSSKGDDLIGTLFAVFFLTCLVVIIAAVTYRIFTWGFLGK